jgi:hypothetical protein
MADKKTQRPFTKQIGRNTFEVNKNKKTKQI